MTRQQIGRKCFPDWKSGQGEYIETRGEIGRKFQFLSVQNLIDDQELTQYGSSDSEL